MGDCVMANNLSKGALVPSDALTTTDISGANWSGDTYTSEWERVLYPFFATALQTDEDGDLFIDFSLDGGATFSSYPVIGYDIAAGINEVHSAYKGSRSMRIRFVGTGGRTYFRLLTDYCTSQIQLNSTLRQDLSVDSDSVTVKAVAAGEVTNPDGSGTGVVSTAQLTPDRAQIVDMQPTTFFRDNSQMSGALPSGATPTYTPAAPIVAANVIDSFWIDASRWNVSRHRFIADVSGIKVFIIDASDELGNNSTTNNFSQPTFISTAGLSRNVKAPNFQQFVRIIIFNDTGSTANDWGFRSRGNNSDDSSISISADQFVSTFFPMALGQNLIRGESDDGTTATYPAQVHRDAATGAVSLAVVQGARISEAFGKEHVQSTVSANGTVTPVTLTLHTVTASTRFWMTSIEVTLTNELSAGGILEVTDDGVAVRQYAIPSGTNQTTGTTNITIDYTEPVLFETDVEFVVPATGLGSNVAVNITGYEEPI